MFLSNSDWAFDVTIKLLSPIKESLAAATPPLSLKTAAAATADACLELLELGLLAFDFLAFALD